MDIEIKLRQAIEQARGVFYNHIRDKNDEMKNAQAGLLTQINAEVSSFGPKLREDVNRERDTLEQRIANDDITVLDEYSIEMRDFITDLLEEENKDLIDELINNFTERIDQEIGKRDSRMTTSRDQEWKSIQEEIYRQQNQRNRNIIMEIINTSQAFEQAIRK